MIHLVLLAWNFSPPVATTSPMRQSIFVKNLRNISTTRELFPGNGECMGLTEEHFSDIQEQLTFLVHRQPDSEFWGHVSFKRPVLDCARTEERSWRLEDKFAFFLVFTKENANMPSQPRLCPFVFAQFKSGPFQHKTSLKEYAMLTVICKLLILNNSGHFKMSCS